MKTTIIEFFKKHQENIVLLVGVILVSLISFAMGYIIAKQQKEESIKIEQINEYQMRELV